MNTAWKLAYTKPNLSIDLTLLAEDIKKEERQICEDYENLKRAFSGPEWKDHNSTYIKANLASYVFSTKHEMQELILRYGTLFPIFHPGG